MNRIIKIITLLVFAACAREEAVPVIVDFDFEVFNDDFSIPVQIVFFNRTEGAEDYEWRFEGGVPSRSVNRNPGVIQYDSKGNFEIELIATNQDGSRDSKIIEIQIDDPVIIDFEVTNVDDNFSPAAFSIQNNSTGADSFVWTFEGGQPVSSTSENPGNVVFTEPGEHRITLEISNGRETFTQEEVITVEPFLVADFTEEVAFDDDDFQIPAVMQFTDNSVSATSYQWQFEGASITTSLEQNPNVTFVSEGNHRVTLTASNGKETQTISKVFQFFRNTNLRELNDVVLGINTAHNANTRGSFYSIADRTVYTAEEITTDIADQIDLVFFGLSNTFNRNRFVSPDDLSSTTFDALANAKQTKFINSQELCNCTASLSVSEFDNMQDDTLLNGLTITETPGGLQDFDNSMVLRIVLFETQEGKKGAIKVKEFIDDGSNSYIIVDIKVQKATR
ncbi:PKD domain-containing protein [Aquimarina spongiae]|uniref:PKD domain-containing protein n=1 Tax=Aquimarina spongiae TaxID=570521 RepID=A0A1M6AB87_9FLAO|nr:PKD domain-containing protein [Aquimarina spongiae]SHI33736.1 PKD domain-containing protein [Aquimarina spongiae]